MEPLLIVPLSKAWSPEAREAAAAARKAAKQQPMHPANAAITRGTIRKPAPEAEPKKHATSNAVITENTPFSTRVEQTIETDPAVRFHPPSGKDVTLDREDHALEYNSDALREKYGEQRGEASYQAQIDRPGNAGARPFVIHDQIQKEKYAMMKDLGKSGSASGHHYQGLYKLWMERK